MSVTAKELVAQFADAVAVGDAAVFIGAGTSQASGLPGWADLIEHARVQANVPAEITDAPLAAQYIANTNGAGALHAEIKRMIDRPASPTTAHRILAQLPIRDYWTTNYDLLIEDTMEEQGTSYQWVVGEQDYSRGTAAGTNTKRVTKMHGSLTREEVGQRSWEVPPVITRSDFERYEELHPITWTRLRASWLTNSFLFLGLSFDDPNLNLLLRLSRSLPADIDAPPHFVVFTRKTDQPDARLQQLRVSDLEDSGVNVHMIDAHENLGPLVRQLEVRCRPAMLFISGSFPLEEGADRDTTAIDVAEFLAITLAGLDKQTRPTLVSFGGPAGQVVSKRFRDTLPPAEYQPDSVRFYYRKARGSDESIPIEHRVGMVTFTERSLDDMRDFVFPQLRAMAVIAGGSRTLDEVRSARNHDVLVIPIGVTGGAAKQLWDEMKPSDLGLKQDDELTWWGQLNDGAPALAAHAASKLIKRLMFE